MADNTNRLAGTATVTADGVSYAVVGDFSYRVAKFTRETLKGMDGVHGFKETPQAGMIGVTLRDTGGLTVADLNDMTDVTVIAQLANGKVIVGRNMWTVDDQEVKSDDATVPVKWEGPDVSEN